MKMSQYADCVGNNCCASGTTYNADSNQCIPDPQKFTSLSQAYANGEFVDNKIQNFNDQHTSLIFSSYT